MENTVNPMGEKAVQILEEEGLKVASRSLMLLVLKRKAANVKAT